ncbi:GNAT family N-acetyltransferase [Myxococcus sp. CA018]|nr:GNAT family N-acetyltransferase [Myxococcus sp. CA018]
MTCRVVATQQELDDALRVRWVVFGGELRLMARRGLPTQREVNGFDTLSSTVHLVVYVEHEPVATVRILLPNPEVASSTGGVLGVEMEQRLDLTGLVEPGQVVAEAARFCVLRQWRHSEALIPGESTYLSRGRDISP